MEFGYAVPETLKPALDYKPRILGPKIEEFHCLLHKLSVILSSLQYKLQWKMEVKNIQAATYIRACTVFIIEKRSVKPLWFLKLKFER